VHALQLGLPVDEIETPYYARPEGSSSKLSTWRDGFRILLTIANLYRAERPLPFFACFGLIAALVSIGPDPDHHTSRDGAGATIADPCWRQVSCYWHFCVPGSACADTVTRGRREMNCSLTSPNTQPGYIRTVELFRAIVGYDHDNVTFATHGPVYV
jgi:hypothetical protein